MIEAPWIADDSFWRPDLTGPERHAVQTIFACFTD
jgi:hypothetical protein